jgi:hypothetical protein
LKKIDTTTVIEQDTFIAQYLEYMEEVETSKVYDLFCALWCISFIATRKVFIDRPRARVYLNMYVLLIAESGVTRKSTAVRFVEKLLNDVREEIDNEFLLITGKSTPEKLVHDLHKQTRDYGYAQAAISVSELVTFLGKERYAMPMPGLLTDLYDCPELRTGGGTVSNGTVTIRDVYINFLSASAPSWLARAINPDVIEGGFTSRCIFVHDEQPKRKIAWPKPREDSARSYDRVKQRLLELYRRLRTDDSGRGRFGSNAGVHRGHSTTLSLSPEGMAIYKDWYETRPFSADPFRASFESREDDHVLRLSGLFALNNGRLVISGQEVKFAIELVEWSKEQGARIFAYDVEDPVVRGIDKLRTILVNAGTVGIKQTDITKKMFGTFNAKQTKQALAIMHELDMVQMFETPHKGHRRATIWRATKLITGEHVIGTVLEQWEFT